MKNESPLVIETFPIGSLSCNCSLLFSPVTREAIAIDPGDNITAFMHEVEKRQLKLKKILHTHAHFDHIGCSKLVKDKTGATLHLHKGDQLLYQALPAQAMMFGFPPSIAGKIDHWIEDEEEYSLDDQALKNFLKALYTPGHTQGSCSFYCETGNGPMLFAGDTLFQGSIGRTDLPGGDFATIKKSIKERLYRLPEETSVVTGHGPKTSIFQERRNNPYVCD